MTEKLITEAVKHGFTHEELPMGAHLISKQVGPWTRKGLLICDDGAAFQWESRIKTSGNPKTHKEMRETLGLA